MNLRVATYLLICLMATTAMAQEAAVEIPLWPNGAPGFESRRNEKQVAKDYWVANIHNPSLTIYLPPKEKATGAAVVICPGGGHRLLVFNAEGDEPARYLAALGVTAFALKYRLGREEGSPYSIEKHAREDGQRAMRLVLAANDDECCSSPVLKLLQGYRDAKVSVEAHLYARGSHAFNMGNRSQLASIKGWPQRMADWLADNNILRRSP